MHGHRRRRADRMGAAMLLGALVGFVVGASAGFGSPDMAAPVVMPLVGAIAGSAIAWLPFLLLDGRHRRSDARARELAHARIRAQAHDGWIEDVDLSAVRPRPADAASGRRTQPG